MRKGARLACRWEPSDRAVVRRSSIFRPPPPARPPGAIGGWQCHWPSRPRGRTAWPVGQPDPGFRADLNPAPRLDPGALRTFAIMQTAVVIGAPHLCIARRPASPTNGMTALVLPGGDDAAQVAAGRRPACALCKRHKAACDRNRPCDRCERRGAICADPAPCVRRRPLGPRLSAACGPCARSKVRCEATTPCSRCVRLHLDDMCIASRGDPASAVSRRSTGRPCGDPWNSWHMQGHCGQVVAQVGRYWQPAPDPVLPVLTPVGTPTCIPEMLTKAIKYGHRAFPPDLVRSLPPDILNAYLRIVRCVLTPTDVRWIYNDVRRSRADWPVTVPTPSAEYNGLVASPMSPCQQQQQSVPTLTYYICSTGQSNDARATLNGAARALLGYTNDDLQSRSTVHQESMLGMFLPNFWKLFHPVSWRDIAHHFIRCWVQGCTTMHFARLVYVAKNGTLVEARSQWRSELTAEDPDESATDSDDSVALPTRMTRQVLIMEFDPL